MSFQQNQNTLVMGDSFALCGISNHHLFPRSCNPISLASLQQQNGVVMAIESLQCHEKFGGLCYPMYLDSSFYWNSFSFLLVHGHVVQGLGDSFFQNFPFGQSSTFEIQLGNMVSLQSQWEIIDEFLQQACRHLPCNYWFVKKSIPM